MISARPVEVDELTKRELGWIVEYSQKCWEPFPPEKVIERARKHEICIYQFTGDCEGIFILGYTDGGMFVETIAGEHIVENFDEIYEKVKSVAKALNARNLYTYLARPSLERLFERKTTATKVASLYRETIS